MGKGQTDHLLIHTIAATLWPCGHSPSLCLSPCGPSRSSRRSPSGRGKPARPVANAVGQVATVLFSRDRHSDRIPGCAGRTYRECFRPLENANRYVRHHACVLFAPIRFRRPPLRGRTITIEFTPAVRLSPRNANKRTRPDAVYRVSFHTGSWSERERDRFRRGRPARLDLPARGHRNSVREIPDKVKLRFAPQHHQQSVPVPPSFPLEPGRNFAAGQ